MVVSFPNEVTTSVFLRLRPLILLALAYALFLLAVYWPEPRHVSMLWIMLKKRPGTDWFAFLAPIVPPLVYFALAPLYLLQSKIVDHIVAMIVRIFVIIAFADMVISFVFAGSMSSSANAGVTLLIFGTVVLWMLLLCSIGNRLAVRDSIMAAVPPILPASYIAVFAAWSILSGVMTAVQAWWIVDGRPYCIASATRHPSYAAIASPFDLRGSHNYSDLPASPSSEGRYHALLVVADPDGRYRYWNWSIPWMSWQPNSRIGGRHVCEPQANFLSRLFRF